jgi:branched-subunit amino acid transport protein
MTPWLIIVAAAAGTYLLRISMLVVSARRGVPPLLERVARFAAPTAFAALAATSLAGYAKDGGAAIAPYLAVAAAVVAVRRTGSPRAALLVGMPTMWLLSAALH